jgi:hypothetical protein
MKIKYYLRSVISNDVTLCKTVDGILYRLYPDGWYKAEYQDGVDKIDYYKEITEEEAFLFMI